MQRLCLRRSQSLAKDESFRLKRLDDYGNWELVLSSDRLHHLDWYTNYLLNGREEVESAFSYANYVVQDPRATHLFSARV